MANKAGRVALISAGIAAALCATSPLASAASLAGGSGAHADTTPKRIGTTPRIPVGAHKTGTTAPSTELHLSVTLKPRDPAALEAFVKATTTPGNPQYHHFLATGEFAKAFGPTQQTIDSVKAALRQAGLNPGQVSENGLFIPVTATAEQAAKAFNTGFQNLTLPNGKQGYVSTAAPAMPANVAPLVGGVVGLSNTTQYATHVVKGKSKVVSTTAGLSSRTVAPHASGPALCSEVSGTLGATNDTKTYYSPGSLASAYSMQHTYSSGAGQTVAVFELENVDHPSLNLYQSCLGTHTPILYTSVHGGPTHAADNNNYGVESLLDIEDLIGLVPGATIHDYMGPDAQNATDADVLATYQQIVNDNSAQVISTSWGLCEPSANTDATMLNSESLIFQQAAAQGQSVVAASGDSGSSDCYRANVSNDTSFQVDDPASQPYVTGVGGTKLQGSGSALKETVWNDGISGGAGGGGISKIWPAQTFQSGFTSAANRAVPDVTALGDPASGYPLFLRDTSNNQHLVGVIGGTSGAAPTWAAAIAQANAANPCLVGRAGYLNPLLYKAASTSYGSAFRDITVGNNDIAGDGTATYSAATGYDEASGLGSPKVSGLGALCQNQNTGTFHQLANPTRVVSVQKMSAGQTLTAKVGVSPIPSTGVTAVVANITVTGTGGNGWTTGYPAGTARPGVATTEWTGSWVARKTTATIPVSPNGSFSYYTSQSGTFSIDILGYYTKDTTGLYYNTVSPARLLDTRYAVGVPTRTPIVNGTVNFQVGGKDGIPSDATAVLLNVSTLYGVGGGSLTAYAGQTNKPGLSQMYWDSAVPIRTNLLVVPVGADGTVNIAVSGQTHVLADVFGYYYGTGKQFAPLTQSRLASGSLAAKSLHVYQVAGVNGIPSGVKAVALTISAGNNPGGGYIEAWDDLGTRVDTSATLWQGGQQTSNQVIVPVGADGKIDLYISTAATVTLDVNGYFK